MTRVRYKIADYLEALSMWVRPRGEPLTHEQALVLIRTRNDLLRLIMEARRD